MPDWNALRRRAYEYHLQLRAFLPPDAPTPLPAAAALLQAAQEATEVIRVAVPPGDALLAGAYAVLDRDIPGIWHASGPGIRKDRERFAQAHEFAHFWLHPEIGHDACIAEDTPDAFAPPTFRLPNSQLAEGYSHKERRESEANLFAAELLLPGPVLRHVFLEHGWKANKIAAHSGLSASCVLSQLAYALLAGGREQGRKEEEKKRRKEEGNRKTIPNPEHLSTRTPEHQTPNTLDASQRAAARIEAGPVLVDAGPGTGKTRTLIARILYLLTERKVPPENILALTFSNKAAEEMHTRLRGEVGDLADRVWIGTFHAFGRELLRKEGYHLGLSQSPELLDTPDAIMLLENHLDRLRLRHLEYLSHPILPFADILNCISRAKDELKTPQDYAHAAQLQLAKAAQMAKKAEAEKQQEIGEKSLEVAQVYAVYEELLREEGKLDFGDLLMRSVELLDRFPEVQARWQAQYPHILADEYQDINRASAQLVQRLAGDGRGLWAVGDLRQAIYRFRGASPANVRQFDLDFPGGRRLQLERNYRSRPELVAMFGAYAGGMAGTTATFADWQPQREQGEIAADLPTVTIAVSEDEQGQAAGLAAQIRHREAAGIPLRDQVILCHTHRQASRLAELLGVEGIETQHVSGLFEREEIKDLLALLALACEPEGTALPRVARFAEYAIPPADVLLLFAVAREQGKSFPAVLMLAETLPELSEAGRAGFRKLWQHIHLYLYHGTAWSFLTGYLFETSEYLRPLLQDESAAGRRCLLAIQELLVVAQGLAKRFETEENQQAAFLKYLRFLLACGQEKSLRVAGDDAELDGVRLMTVHRSKGLEFPVVYLPNLVKDQFPPGKMGRMVSSPEWTDSAEPEGMESESAEAECLFFVALSRARDALVLSRPRTWNGKPIEPSSLLTGCEAALAACHAQHVVWEAEPIALREDAGMTADVTAETGNEPTVTFSEQGAASTEQGAASSAPTIYLDGVPVETEAIVEPLTITASAAEQYRRCPRQYYYQRVLKLPVREDDSAYLYFHNSVQETVGWLQTERAEGRNPTPEAIEEKLQAVWEGDRKVPHTAHARVLKERAVRLLTGAHQSVAGAQESQRSLELIAQLAHGAIRVRVDHAEETPDGGMRLIDYKAQRDETDHRRPRLALARHAARQQFDRPVQVMLGYLDDGTQKEVAEKARYEPERVEKYNEALKGIREERFEPNRSQACGQCPYFLICPL